MVKSKGWDWRKVSGDGAKIWLEPSIESYYLLNRWQGQGKHDFLDLGCGLGRHAILFGQHDFNVSCFDISEEAITQTRDWAQREGLAFGYQVGDMLQLPYGDQSFDCVLCRNVISHTDTAGMRQVIAELKRILRPGGECYLTLGSKDTWGWRQTDWPLVDENTRLRMEPGPEYETPHFYVDYQDAQRLFADFQILQIYQVVDYHADGDQVFDSYHYHLLIKK